MNSVSVDTTTTPTRVRARTRVGPVGLRAAAAAAVLVVWWLASSSFLGGVVPGPLATAERLWHIIRYEAFVSSVGLTLGRVGAGMLISVAIAVIVGIAMGRSRVAEQFLDTFVLIGRTIPGLVWALVAVMIVGLNNTAPVLAVVLTATPLVAVQIWEGAKALEAELFDMAKVFEVSRAEQLRRIVLPALVPSIVAGTKLGLSLAWQVVVLAELFGLGAGVGYQIHENFSDFDIAGVLAWTISFSVIMAGIEYGVIGRVQARLERWRPTAG